VIADNFMPVKQEYEDGIHQRHWSRAEFEQGLNDSDFELVRYQPLFFLLNAPIRYRHTSFGSVSAKIWDRIQRQVAGNERRGNIFGCGAYMLDAALARLFPSGPGIHYLLCRKR
jgi:hypothetical protein